MPIELSSPFFHLGISQINPKVGDFEENFSKIITSTRHLEREAQVIALSPYALTGYPLMGFLQRKDFLEKALTYLHRLKEETKDIKALLVLGLPMYEGGKVFSSVVLIYKGEILKIFHRLPYSKQGDEAKELAPVVFEIDGIRVGVSYFEEYKNLLRVENSKENILILLSTKPYIYGDYADLVSFLKGEAKGRQSYIAFVNLVGAQDEFIFEGRSMIISPDGEILSQAQAFAEDHLIVKLSTAGLKALEVKEGAEKGKVPSTQEKEREGAEDISELYEALKLALRDYFYKNNFRGVILGLSGGIDSALVAVLAVDALGKEKVKALFMPSEFTSKESMEDAYRLSQNLGIPLITVPITSIFESYRGEMKKLGYEDFSVADENLQARIRANLLFYFSNREGYLVLSTSNKSEAATGYTTIYGDMSGGFAPLKDVYKTWVYKLAYYRNSLYPVIPERILVKAPSAELRPGQRDEDTLPPYKILDEILYLHLEEGLDLEEIIKRGFEQELVVKIFKMIKIAEYKRRQAPLGPKVTRCALGVDYKIPVTCTFY